MPTSGPVGPRDARVSRLACLIWARYRAPVAKAKKPFLTGVHGTLGVIVARLSFARRAMLDATPNGVLHAYGPARPSG